MAQDTNPPGDWKRTLTYIFILVLAVIFAIDWGPGSRGFTSSIDVKREQDSVAQVNGQTIPSRDFRAAYEDNLENLRARGLPAEMARQFGLPKQVTDQLVARELWAQAAEARGVSVSDAELLEFLTRQPAFQTDGGFDAARYTRFVVDYRRETTPAFEARLRRELASARLRQLVEATAVVSEDEARARYRVDGDRAKVSFVRFEVANFAAQVSPAKPDELRRWMASNEAAIAAYYEENKATYFEQEQVKARQLLVRVDKEASAEVKAQARAKAEALRAEVVGGKDFAEVARASSDDAETREQGGDLGAVERLQLPTALADALFAPALPLNTVTQVIETPLGFYLGLVSERIPAKQKALDQVKDEVAGVVFVRNGARALMEKKAAELLAQLKAGKSLQELYPPRQTEGESSLSFATSGQPETKETGDFNRSSETIPSLGQSEAAKAAIFSRTTAGVLDAPVAMADGSLAVLVVTERTVPTDAEYEAQKAEFLEQARKAKQFELVQSFEKGLRQSAQVVVNEAQVTKLVGAEG